jgi:hypothetical protein
MLKEGHIMKDGDSEYANIEYCSLLGRIIRKDDWPQLGDSTFIKLKNAIKNHDNEDALKVLEYLMIEGKSLHDGFCDWTYADLDYIAKNYGEEEIPKLLRYVYGILTKSVYKFVEGMTLEDMVYRSAELNRSHRAGPGESGQIKITEEEDRYIMSFDPCGSGGRMRRTGAIDGIPPRTEPPFNLGKTTKPYDWSWGKTGVPYYCAHCCVWNEQIAIETIGYPVRVTEYNEDPEGPCAFIYYKDPDLIPEHYFTRVGKKKDKSLFKRL